MYTSLEVHVQTVNVHWLFYTAHIQTNACLPVMARPRIKAAEWSVSAQSNESWALTMDITLALVRLHHKQVGHMPPNMILVACRIATKDFLETVHSQ